MAESATVRSPAAGPAGAPITTPYDPAGETSPDGRPWLQVRLSAWGKVMSLVQIAYWTVWWFTYVGPSGDPAATVRIAPAALLAWVAYLSLWLVGRGKVRPLSFLKAVDVFVFSVIGVSFALGVAAHPVPQVVSTEALLGLLLVTFLRAILIPSDPGRTLLVGGLLVAPSIATAYAGRVRLAPEAVAPDTYWVTFVTWCVLACAVSWVAANIVYGLGRRAHDARRLGQYTLVEELGRGGMGVVYRARHALLRRSTAIKLLMGPQADRRLARFEREVQLMAEISHPNIVTVHDYGRTSTGVFYYVMEHLDGLDLERLVQHHGPQCPERVVHVLIQACAGLARAHAAGLVHRDIKPANIYLCRAAGDPDMVKVLDFGLVKDLRAVEETALTNEQKFLGTPLYISPEACTEPDTVSALADLYSLGAVAYYLLSGKLLFEGKTLLEVVSHHIHSTPIPISERAKVPLSAELEQIIMRCLEKRPADRFADADQMRTALEHCPEAGLWSRERAGAWWSEHGEQPRPAAGRPESREAFTQTIQVERAFVPEAHS